MSDNLDQFCANIRQFAEQHVPEQVKAATAKLAMDGLNGVVDKTPVKTGRAKGGWDVGINEMPQPVAIMVGGSAGDTGRLDPGGEATKAAGKAKIEQAPPFSEVNIVNNVEYVVPLEDGRSQQGGHMVALTAEELKAQFR